MRYKLKKEHVEVLRAPRGILADGVEELRKKIKRPLISVGDRVSANLLDAGIEPDLIIHDDHEQRKLIDQKTFDTIYGFVAPELVVKNKKGEISDDLWKGIEVALRELPHRIRVVGEEDLAALAVMALAPTGSSVVYGLFDKNKVLLVHITEHVKDKALKLINE